MTAVIDRSEPFPTPDFSELKVAIIYDDFATGTWAKHFAERLAHRLGRGCQLSKSLWRSELLECPEIAAEAARASMDCDYLIIALRSDRALPLATRLWIEAQLDGAAARGTGLIALVDSGAAGPVRKMRIKGDTEIEGERWRSGEGARHHLRSLCAEQGVPFFSHAVTPPEEDAATDIDAEEVPFRRNLTGRRWRPAPHPF